MLKQSIAQLLLIGKNLPDLFRYFPYFDLSAQFLPLYAYLYIQSEMSSPAALLMMVPFIFSNAAGFAYNNLSDRNDPSFKQNPIAEGKISTRQARWIIGICTALSILIFGILYRSTAAWGAYLVYLILGAAYSGLGLRIKATVAGPLLAAFIIWTAGPLILGLEYARLKDPIVSSYLVAVCLIYVGREIYHTIIDRENDLRAGTQTFATRTNSFTQRAALLLALTAGGICLLWSSRSFLIDYADRTNTGVFALLVSLVCFAILTEAFYLLRHRGYHPSTAFLIYRTALILYAAILLDLPAFIAALLLWAFLMGRRS